MSNQRIFRERITNGLLIILCFTICFIFLVAVFRTNAEDRELYINEMHNRIIRENNTEAEKYVPTMSKWDFEIMLPVEGSSGLFHWKVMGAFSANKDNREQRIYGFSGETMDEKSPVRLVSSEMIFIEEEKELYTNKPFFAEMGWGSITGTDMVLRLDGNIIDVRKGVEVALDIAALPEGSVDFAGTYEAAEGGGGEGSAAGKENAENKKENGAADQLVITSEKLKILGKEDKAIFSGKVVGRDKDGTISADVMEVQNYTKEERKADPAKNGVKTVICKGHVKIDLPDQAAKCHNAVFNASDNTVTLIGTEIAGQFVQVEYWTKDNQQILCDKMIINRETKEVEFLGNQKSTDYNPSKSSFLDFGIDGDDKKEKQDKDSTGSDADKKDAKEK